MATEAQLIKGVLNLKSKILKVTTAVALTLSLVSGAVPSLINEASAASVKVDGYDYPQEAVNILNELNAIRRASGISTDLTLDPMLTKAAQGHATYLGTNGAEGHSQDKTLPNFTGVTFQDRLKALGGTNIFNTFGGQYYSEGISSQGLDKAVRSLLAAPYHRFSMIDPNLYTIGVGFSGKKVVFMYALKRGDNYDSTNTTNILFPYDGQTNLDISMLAPESPDPLEGTGLTYSEAGYIPTATLANTSSLTTVPASMTDSQGNKIQVIVKKDKDKGTELRTGYASWLVIPKKPLSYNTTYNMNINGVKWSFTTKAGSNGSGHTGGSSNGGGNSSSDMIYISKNQQASKAELLAKTLDPKKKFTASNAGIRINGEYVTLTPSAKVINGATYIPLRGVFEKLGSQVFWNQQAQRITIMHGQSEVILRIGSKEANVDGYYKTLPKAPFTQNGTTYIPLRFVSEAIGGTVLWDGKSNTVSIVAEYNK